MTRQELINQASKYIKDVAYDNPNQFTQWYWKDNKAHAWCGVFIDYVVKHDLKCNWLDSCSNFAGCGSIVDWAKKMGYWKTDYKKAKKGDLVMYGWNTSNPNNYSHIGIVDEVTSSGITSVEGNTSYGDYSANCVARKNRDKKYIKGVILLPYEEEVMKFNIGDVIECIKDTKLYTTVEEKESKYTIKKGDIAYVKLIYGNKYIGLADVESKKYFPSCWTKELDNFKLYEVDYQKLYEEEVEKNKDLENRINKAIEVLNG